MELIVLIVISLTFLVFFATATNKNVFLNVRTFWGRGNLRITNTSTRKQKNYSSNRTQTTSTRCPQCNVKIRPENLFSHQISKCPKRPKPTPPPSIWF
jgi:hypothetical protein